MAMGERRPVIMESSRAVPNGVATLGTDGKLLDTQIPGLAKLGAAPAGYGLGSNSAKVLTNADLLDNVTDGGWHYWNAYSPDGIPSDVPFNIQFGCMRVDNGSFYDYRVQTVYDMANICAVRRSIGGSAVVSTPWEWINPPMNIGVDEIEYRTTERHNGKPVYVKMWNYGRLPNNTCLDIEHGLENVKSIFIDLGKSVITTDYAYPDTLYLNLAPVFKDIVTLCATTNDQSKNVIRVETSSDMSGFYAYLYLKYTKTTD